MNVTIEKIGPEEARHLLGSNPSNRRISPHRVATMSRAMLTGQWKLNGDAIRLNGDGPLRDGQHRLLAVMASGATIETLVVRGLTDDAIPTLDTGRKRTAADVLAIRGERNAPQLGGAICVCVLYENYGDLAKAGSLWPTIPEQLAYLDDNPNLRFSIPIGGRAQASELRLPGSLVSGLHYLMCRIDAPAADAFWEMVVTGAELTEHHPARRLRIQVLRDLRQTRRMPRRVLAAISVKAWNFYRSAKPVRHLLAWRSTGPTAEEFPSIR